MVYRIDFSADIGFPFYQEIEFQNVNTGNPMNPAGMAAIDHQLNITGWLRDYGCWEPCGFLLASNSNGLITNPEPSVIAIAVPFANFGMLGLDPDDYGTFGPSWLGCGTRPYSLRYTLSAQPLVQPSAQPPQLIASGTITFGDR